MARDVDSIRASLDQPKISYYAFSYGTYLGEVYATLFPDRVRRMVLDSTVDPQGVWYADNIDQDYAFQARMEAFFGWVARYSSTYHLGTTAAQVQQAWYTARNRLAAQPDLRPERPAHRRRRVRRHVPAGRVQQHATGPAWPRPCPRTWCRTRPARC